MGIINWSSELRETWNKKTNKHYYFILICDVWRRVSHAAYMSRDLDANRRDSMSTRVRGHLVTHCKTVYGIHHTKRA